MVVRYCRSKCSSAFFGTLYVYLLLECAISTSANKAQSDSRHVMYVQAVAEHKSAYDKEQLHFQRQRRKLHTDTNDQLNSLEDDSGFQQYQEYQGVFGRPGVDFPVLSRIPVTKFNCRDVKNSHNGYYADMETNCQVFHVCDSGRKISFLCPNGTIFRQSHLICDWWFRVDCERSPELYEHSVKHLESDQSRFKQRAQAISNAMHNAMQKGVPESTLLESPVSVMTRPYDDFNSESELPHGNVFRQRPQLRPDDSPSFNRAPNQNAVADLPPPRSFSSGPTGAGVQPTSNPRTNYNRTYFHDEEPTNANFNNHRNHPTHAGRVKFASNTNLNPPPPPKTTFDTLHVRPTSNPDGFNNNFNAEFGLPPNQNFNNQDFNKGELPDEYNVVYNPTFQPRTKPTSTPTTGHFNHRHINNHFPPSRNQPPPQDALPASRNRFNPASPYTATPSRPTQTATSPTRTRFSTTSKSTQPLPPTFAVTALSWNSVISTTSPPRTTFSVTPPPRTGDFRGDDRVPQTQVTANTPTTPVANDVHEQQILAETAAFAGNGKYSNFRDFYYPQNFVGNTNNDFAELSAPVTSTKSAEVTSNLSEQYGTTFRPENEFVETGARNDTRDTYALYYPSANDNANLINGVTSVPNENAVRPNTTKPAISEFLLKSAPPSTERPAESPVDSAISLLLTNLTKERYIQLFPKKENASSGSDLQSAHSSGLVQSNSPQSPSSSATASPQPKSTPDFRELAQIFSRALSAYLEDPEQFRKVLSEVRPTEPPPLDSLRGEAAAEDEVLAFSEDNERSTSSRAPSTATPTTASTRGIKDPETFAEEINNFMYTDHTFRGADSAEFNVNETYYPDHANATTDVTFTVSPLIDFTVNRSDTFSTTVSDVVPTTLPIYEAAPKKGNLYDDGQTNGLASDPNPQSLSDEQLLITADTQSFLARDNLVKLQQQQQQQQQSRYDEYAPVLKTSKYPAFGLRTNTVTKAPFITSRADFAETTAASRDGGYSPYAARTDAYSPETQFPSTDADPPATTDREDDFLTTLSTLATAQTSGSAFNKSTVQAMVDMMEEARSDPTLRRKLVLLLVNDRGGAPENRSVRSMKSKLLRALLVSPSSSSSSSPSTRAYGSYTQPQVAESRRAYRVETSPHSFRTTPAYVPAADVYPRDERGTPSRGGNAAAATNADDSGDLSEADARAVDLLKTLYSIASNKWKQ